MQIYVDDAPLESTVDAATLGEAIECARKRANEDDRVIVSVVCDGTELQNDVLDARRPDPAEAFGRVEFRTSRPKDVVADAMQNALAVLEDTDQDRGQVVEWIAQGDMQRVNDTLGDCFQSWGQVHIAICQAMRLLGLDPETVEVGGQPIHQSLSLVADQLKQIKEVILAEDFVLLGDLLEYEFGEATDRWRAAIQAILEHAAGEAGKV